MKFDFRYSKHSDLVFHILAHLKVNNASDLYDEKYIAKMTEAKRDFNFVYNIIPEINSLKEYYNDNVQRLGLINFLPYFCNDLSEFKNMLLNYNEFTKDDIQYFINPFIKIMENESGFYFEYWDNLHKNNTDSIKLIEEYLSAKLNQFSCIFKYFKKDALAFLSYSITRNGRGFSMNNNFSAAIPFPKEQNEFISAFFILLHEYTHSFTDNLLNTEINFDDGSHDLSEYAVILADYYLIKAIDEELIQSYLKMFNGNITENDFLNIYKVEESLEIKIKNLVKDIISCYNNPMQSSNYIEIKGKYNTAKVFTSELDELSREQIENLCNQSFTEGSKIRLMPDVHAGAGCTIGTTMTIKDKIVPNLVGVDIGCGMETVIIKSELTEAKNFDPVCVDKIINAEIPSGMNVRDTEHEFVSKIEIDNIRCPAIDKNRARKSIGTLGGGNHFIEANRDEENNLYIVVHSGSRHLGTEIAEYYQEQAWQQLNGNRKVDIDKVISQLKADGREKEIQSTVSKLRSQIITDIPRDLAYVSGELFDDYIHDMKITQAFALVNRKAMMKIILDGLGIKEVSEQFSTIHNYIDTDSMILRKGAVSAKQGEKLIVPINMRDGSLICEGLGNPDWNFSSPHGAGRIMSRKKAFASLKMEDYVKEMQGIYSTSVSEHTLDESPMAYKSMDNIIAHIEQTAKILHIIKPVYNFKAAEDLTPPWKRK